MSSEWRLLGLREDYVVALRQNSKTGQSGFATSIHCFLLYINFIEGFKQIKCDDKNILIYQLASDYQINNGTAGWSVLGGFALGGCLCQIMLVRKILGFSALTNQPTKQARGRNATITTNKNV